MSKLFSLLAVSAAVSAFFYLDRRNRPPARVKAAAPGRSWDDYLASRVRSMLPRSIQVAVRDAAVTLRGSVPYTERDRLLAAALAVPGIERVVNLLETEDRPADLGA
jgi:hypothetical protein